MSAVQLESYIYKVLKSVHPDTGITSDAKESVNSLLNLVLHKLEWLASDRVQLRNKKTLQAEDIGFAVNLLLPSEGRPAPRYSDHITGEGNIRRYATQAWQSAMTKWNASFPEKNASGSKKSSSASAGLIFPPTRIENAIRERSPIKRVSKLVGVVAAAVLEYLTTELLSIAGDVARDDKKILINSAHLYNTISADGELSQLFEGVLLPGGLL